MKKKTVDNSVVIINEDCIEYCISQYLSLLKVFLSIPEIGNTIPGVEVIIIFYRVGNYTMPYCL